MTPAKQTIVHCPEEGRYGDCQRTCIAVILDLQPEQVPHFVDDPSAERDKPEWWANRQAEWLKQHGLTAATMAFAAEVPLETVLNWTSRQSPDTPMILCGTSRLGSNHVVVVLNGEIVCDPSGNGIVGPSQEGTWEVTVLGVGCNWREAQEAPGQ